MKRYVVRLRDEERQTLRMVTTTGRSAARKILHANILLQADTDGMNRTDEEVAAALGCHVRTVENLRRRFVLQGLAAALDRKRQEHPSRERKLDGEGEARLVALACSEPPEGRTRWTLQLLADALVTWEVVEAISGQTVRRMLKKTISSPIASSAG